MQRDIKESLKDLDTAQLYIQKAAEHLQRLSDNGEGGADIEDMFLDMLKMIDACDKYRIIWEAEAA